MDSFSNFVEIQKLKKELSAKSGNLVRYVITHTANTEGQTLFSIDLSTFNFRTDSVLVQSGRTLLSPTLDYVVQSHSIVLNEGVPLGRTIDIYVYKNVENLDTEKVIDGRQLGIGSIPLDRLAEDVTPSQVVVTLPVGSWSGSSAPYTMTVVATGVTETNYIIVTPNPTMENLTAVGDCMVMMTEQGVDSATFTAFEDKPEIDITFNLLIGGE